MKKLLLLLCVPLMFSCGEDNKEETKKENVNKSTKNESETKEKKDNIKKQDRSSPSESKGSSSIIDNGAEITILGGESINFGEIIEGEKVNLEFKIKNTGKGDLIITNAKASCGCTQLEYPKEIIKPGNQENISVTFDSKNRSGKQKKNITLTTNATPSIKILTIEGVVLPSKN